MPTYAELQAQIARLQEEADAVRKTELQNVISEVKAKIKEYGLSAKDLGLVGGTPAPVAKREAGSGSVAKYKGPEGQTWSGHGRKPNWLKDALAAGKSIEEFAI
ncbi:H-NS family nucleoid-associated regulatory protein [Derxia gummosa]|uniref:H-NS family nucleoid-associated regulatory protein n=1 Tax=Derxia gummosa DSM 723 TaxID=1121388 RepID=A0A8B6X6B2_9BURK|nr:H-NS histone family protein [Derxia gummosa]